MRALQLVHILHMGILRVPLTFTLQEDMQLPLIFRMKKTKKQQQKKPQHKSNPTNKQKAKQKHHQKPPTPTIKRHILYSAWSAV